MDRDQLIRAHFDAYSDFAWVTDLEPWLSQYKLDAAEMKEYREAWNRHTHARDWDWWQEEVKSMPDAQLQQEIAERRAEIDAFRNVRETDRERFQRVLHSKEETQPIQHATKDRGREM
jgi:hypothetical protein